MHVSDLKRAVARGEARADISPIALTLPIDLLRTAYKLGNCYAKFLRENCR